MKKSNIQTKNLPKTIKGNQWRQTFLPVGIELF
jgi:hypothetical protein